MSRIVKVTWLPLNKVVEVDMDQLPYGDHGEPGSLLDVAMKFGIGLDHACGGVCACSTCHVHVKQGAEHLTDVDESTREYDMLDQAMDQTLESRLGCQAKL